jgi:hypothetical protein
MEPPNDLVAWLAEDEARSRPYRAERLAFLLEHFGTEERGMLFYGGIISAHAFDEMRLCYLNGLFISCVVVAQIVIEHTLARMLSLAGRDDLERVSFQKLVEEAAKERLISQDEFDALDELRRLRNPYTHSKPFMHDSCFVRRSAEADSQPWDLFKEDAEKAVLAVSSLLSRQPFSVGYSEEDDLSTRVSYGAPETDRAIE